MTYLIFTCVEYQREMYNFHIHSSCFVDPPNKYLNSTAAYATDILVKSCHKQKKITLLAGIVDDKIKRFHELRGIVTGERIPISGLCCNYGASVSSCCWNIFTAHIMGYMWCREPDGSVRQGHCQGSYEECGVRWEHFLEVVYSRERWAFWRS